jgi:PIN domain nuclease of toxin-antitoxin system
MTEDRNLEAEQEEASLDTALEAAAEHDLERDASHKQGLIEKETREHGLDEG